MGLFSFFSKSPAKFVKDLSQVGHPSDAEATPEPDFDYIIAGGGTAGAILASRLSEDPDTRVLLLEAGGSGVALPFSRTPSGYTRLFTTRHAFQLWTEPQPFAGNRRRFWPRGKMLGGCSSLNAQMAQYGDPADFDLWARITGDDDWSWKKFSKYFRVFESYTADPDQASKVDLSVKGLGGPVQVGYATRMTNASKAFVKACLNLKIPFSADFNTTFGSMGVNRVRKMMASVFLLTDELSLDELITYVDQKRQRVSSESAYLTPQVLARPNLKVTLYATVTRLLFDGTVEGPRACGVQFSNSKNGPVFQARAAKEVILSAGAVHSPHILLLSGVGPADQLEKHGITVVADLPGVGANLVDHPSTGANFKDKSKTAPVYLSPTKNVWYKIKAFFATMRYLLFRTGPLATNWGEAAAFVRADDHNLFPETEFPAHLKEAASGPTSPDLELFTTGLGLLDHGQRAFQIPSFGIHVCLLQPLSRGTLSLRSADPWDDPLIDPRYLEVQDDVERLIRGLKLCLRLAKTEPLASMVDLDDDHPDLDHRIDSLSNTELEKLVRVRSETLYHPASTCRMAPVHDKGVVDSKLRVYGVHGLRVCDASVFPNIVSGHTAGAVFALGEKLADLIKTGN